MKILITFCISFMMLSCSAIRKKEKPAEDNTYLEATLPPNTFQVIQGQSEIAFYRIEQQLIKGTKEEYSNKSVLVRILQPKETSKLIAWINTDASYLWNVASKKKSPFTPSKEFRLKDNNGQVNILVDENNALVSFINLEGQNIIPITEKLKSYFEKFQ